MAAHIGASLEDGKIATAAILPNFAGRPRSAIRHGVLERSSSARADEGDQQARRLRNVWPGVAHADEDPGARRAAWLSSDSAAGEAEASAIPADHSADSGRRPAGTEEAAAYGQADF